MQRLKKKAAGETRAGRDETRVRILQAALKMLTENGRDAITTRAVSEAAGVQPPILYRFFRDKDGLLDALAEYGFSAYIARKRGKRAGGDPVEALRSGWDLHIEFGLSQPALYLLMYTEPWPGKTSPAAELSFKMLRKHVSEVAATGRLRVSEEQAVNVYHAAAVGAVLVLLSMDRADLALSRISREAALNAIADVEAPSLALDPKAKAAMTLLAALNEGSPFSAGELPLLKEWLTRLVRREHE
jgi:AcrR family transcriptional regulator